MELLVMRHGNAEDSKDDFHRRLTSLGRVEASKAALAIADRGFEPEIIYASPLKRAQETAGIVAEHLRMDVVECDSITPSGSCQRVCELLGQAKVERPLIVSHQPFVSMMIHFLTGEQIFMNTAALCMVRLDVVGRDCGELIWTQ